MENSKRPTQKKWGSLDYENLVNILKNRPHLITEYTPKNSGQPIKQLPVKMAIWEGGNASIQVWDKETKESINLGYLRPDDDQTVANAKKITLSTPPEKNNEFSEF